MHTSVLSEFTHNICFFCAFFSWCFAQLVKLVIAFRKTHKVDLSYFYSTGGWPSAHSATVSGLTTSIGFLDGFNSTIFAFSATFAVITMFDAATVRYASSRQASLLNRVSSRLFGNESGRRKLKEQLGHTWGEVYAGMILGILFSSAVMLIAYGTRHVGAV